MHTIDTQILLDALDTVISVLGFIAASFVLYQKIDKRLTLAETRNLEIWEEMKGNGFLKKKEFDHIVEDKINTAEAVHERIEEKCDAIKADISDLRNRVSSLERRGQ